MEDRAVQYYTEGVDFAELGQHAEAVASFDKALAINSDDAMTWSKRGLALDNLGLYSEADASYEKAIAINPDHADAWYDRGNTFLVIGRNSEAVASYEKAIAINPVLAMVWNNRGIALGRLGQHTEALASYEKAITITPKNTASWYNRGNALISLGRYTEGIASYDRALAINPVFVLTWNRRGNALVSLGRYSEAIISYEKAIAINPDYAEAIQNRQMALKKQMDDVKKGDKKSMFRKKTPLWRQFEDASPQEREGMVDWHEVWESSDGKDIAVRFGKKVRLHGFGGRRSSDVYSMLESVKWVKKIDHTDRWIRLRNSFTNCKEWDQFRLQWIQTHPTCVRCGRTYDEGLQVHHAGRFNQDSVVIEEGFLEGLKHPERFATLCAACHSNLHNFIISRESVVKKNNTRISVIRPVKSERKVKENEKKLLISLVNPCVDWAKKQCLKKVTETDVDEFLTERHIDLSPRKKRRALRELVNLYAVWAKEHGLKRITEANVDAFLTERHIDLSPSTKRGSKKELLHALVTSCVDWAKEHGLKKVTEANVDAFLFERDIDLSPRTRRRSLQASVNSIIESTVL